MVFSQWQRTHQLLAKRLNARGWGHVLFHGSVPVAKRGKLIEHFHQDPACRVFLATDAGSVGLNLQHAAAAVVNMDLPWNPPFWNKESAGVSTGPDPWRAGNQLRPENTIEHGMLATLRSSDRCSQRAGRRRKPDTAERYPPVPLHGERCCRNCCTCSGATHHLSNLPSL